VAQTKRKRRSKHRGNAAGIVEARGRTGRAPGPSERRPDVKTEARQRRLDRLNAPPSWKTSFTRAVIATVIFAAVLFLAFRQPAGTVLGLCAFTLALYIPLGYFTDLFIYRRRVKKGLVK